METLCDLFLKHGSDKWTLDGVSGHYYGPTYDKLLSPLRGSVFKILEIGVLKGASLRAWRDFFPDSTVIGIDNTITPWEEWMIETYNCDGTCRESVEKVLAGRKIDLGIDDGSHWADQQVKSFEIIRPHLRPGAYWIIEDIQHQTTHKRLEDLGFEIHDFRHKRGRFDDVLAVYQHPA